MLCGDILMKKYLYKYIYDNSKTIIGVITFILIGIVIGVVGFNFFSDTDKQELVNNLKNILDSTKSDNFDTANVIKNGIRSNIIYIIIIYIFSFTFFTKQATNIVNICRGIVIGIIVPVLFSIFKTIDATLVFFMYVILPNLLYIPSCIYTTVNSLLLNKKIFLGEDNKLYMLTSEIVKILCSFSIMFLGVFIEQLALLLILKIY